MASKVNADSLLKRAARAIAQPFYILPSERKELDRFDINHPWVQEVLNFFAKDTTEKILKNIEEFRIGQFNSKRVGGNAYEAEEPPGTLARSIHWTIVNAAGGNGTLVEFYYLKYGDYLGLSASGWLTRKMKNGKPMYESIKPGTVPLMQDLKGIPVSNMYYTGSVKLRPWKAKPFINSEIKRKAKKLDRRLARQFCYAGGMMIFHSLLGSKHADDIAAYYLQYVNGVVKD